MNNKIFMLLFGCLLMTSLVIGQELVGDKIVFHKPDDVIEIRPEDIGKVKIEGYNIVPKKPKDRTNDEKIAKLQEEIAEKESLIASWGIEPNCSELKEWAKNNGHPFWEEQQLLSHLENELEGLYE